MDIYLRIHTYIYIFICPLLSEDRPGGIFRYGQTFPWLVGLGGICSHFPRVFGEQMVFLCETISVNFGLTVSNDFVPKHDMTFVTLSIQSEDIFKKKVAVPYNLFQTKKPSS